MPTIRELADAVRARRVGAHELVARSLRRIETLDPDIGAVVALRAEEALDEAIGLDAHLAAGGDTGPLAGLPLLVKDITDVAGMRTTHGSLLYADAPAAATDALVVARLRAAGAIVVGKANAPEFACAGYTANLVFGPTRNPWNLERTPGGSSGGSAAALAAGMVSIATATDTGGSIRIPAAYCGLVGLKPTNGTIPRDPAARVMDWIDMTTDGPLGLTVDDVCLQLAVLAGTGPIEPSGAPSRLFVLDRWVPRMPLPAEDATLFEAAVAVLAAEMGLEPERPDVSELFHGVDLDVDWSLIAAPELVSILGGRAAFEAVAERLDPGTAAFAAWGADIAIDAYLAARRRRVALTDALAGLLGDDGIVVSPSMCADAPPAAGPEPPGADVEIGLYDNTVPQNLTGCPAISLPAGVHASGVPFGLQLTAPPSREDLLLSVAEAWERARPWPATAPGYEPFAT
ncbi:MAG TPA: amidase [Actinomycetota bacterium]|nr:amidase [Actinomycetota bacterium]